MEKYSTNANFLQISRVLRPSSRTTSFVRLLLLNLCRVLKSRGHLLGFGESLRLDRPFGLLTGIRNVTFIPRNVRKYIVLTTHQLVNWHALARIHLAGSHNNETENRVRWLEEI